MSAEAIQLNPAQTELAGGARWLLNLESLDALLRGAGFSMAPDRWVNAADLLTQMLEQGALPHEAEAVSLHLAPLFCRSKLEQDQFADLFRGWWREQHSTSAASSQNTSPPLDAGGFKWLGWRSVAVSAALLLIITGSNVLYFAHRHAEQVAVARAAATKAKEELAKAVATVRSESERAAVKPLQPRQPIERDLPPMPGGPPGQQSILAQVLLGIATVLAFALIPMVVGCLLVRSWIGQLVLRRSKAELDKPPDLLRLKSSRDQLFDGPLARRAMKRLHVPVEYLTRRLDVVRSVAATVRRAGLFSPVRAWRARVPEVMLWVNSRGRNDPVLTLAETLVRRLRATDLVVTSYSYRAQPDRLLRHGTRRWHARGEVLAHHAGSRLLVVGNAEGLIDVWSAKPLPWVFEAAAQCDTLVLEPAGRDAGLAAPLHEAGVLLAPLSSEGLEHLVARSSGAQPDRRLKAPQPLPAALRNFERLRSPTPLPRAQGEALLGALRRHLGRRGLRLLSAAAAYPEFHWSLVQALDAQLYADDAPARRELRLLQLAQLPWSRDGWLPDWVRLLLLRRLGRRARHCLRAIYDVLLRAASHEAEVLLPVRVPDPPRLLRQYVRELFKQGARGGPQEDAVFAEFMLGGRFSRLDFELTRAWERVLPGASLRSAHGRAVVAFGSVVLALLCGFGWLQWGGPAFQRQFGLRDALKDVPLTVVYNASTAQLTQQLQQTLGGAFLLNPQLETLDASTLPFETLDEAAVLVHRAGWEAPAQWLAERVRYVSYGAPILLLETEDTRARSVQLGDRALLLWLRRPNQPGHVFSDALSRPFPNQGSEQALEQPAPVPSVETPTQTLESSRIPLSTFRDKLADGSQGPVMVVMPAGNFLMGSPPDERERDKDEGPQHPVTIRAFAISQTEVTFEDYERFARANNRKLPDDSGWGRGTRPVINTGWQEATGYADWLSKQTGQAYRLPSEAEWEYAARAGTTTPFHTGQCISAQQANFDDRSPYAYAGCPFSNKYAGKTERVGVFPANRFGLHDMHGNVLEWVQDCNHENYASAPTDGSAWLEQGNGDCSDRVLRGGTWNSMPQNLRSARRLRYSVDDASLVGFRLARTL